MRVKIIKSHRDTYWYKKFIGEVYTVKQSSGGINWEIEDRDDWYLDQYKYIGKNDCIVLANISGKKYIMKHEF